MLKLKAQSSVSYLIWYISCIRHLMVDLKFKYPMTVSSLGMAMSGLLSYMCCRVLRIVEADNRVSIEFFTTKVDRSP